MSTVLALLSARDAVSKTAPRPDGSRQMFPPPLSVENDEQHPHGTPTEQLTGENVYYQYKAAHDVIDRRKILDAILSLSQAQRSAILAEVNKEAVRRSDLASAIAFTNSLQADLKNRERLLPAREPVVATNSIPAGWAPVPAPNRETSAPTVREPAASTNPAALFSRLQEVAGIPALARPLSRAGIPAIGSSTSQSGLRVVAATGGKVARLSSGVEIDFGDLSAAVEHHEVHQLPVPQKQTFIYAGIQPIYVSGWHRTEYPVDRSGKLTSFSPDGDVNKLQISLFESNKDINDSCMAVYHALLGRCTTNGARVLLPQEVRSLNTVMGLTTQGDNQLTNAARYPDPRAPIFNLSSAQLININGRPVLEVQGNFVNRNNQAGNYFRGVFISTGSHITKLFVQSPDKLEFARGELVYRKILQSIQWA